MCTGKAEIAGNISGHRSVLFVFHPACSRGLSVQVFTRPCRPKEVGKGRNIDVDVFAQEFLKPIASAIFIGPFNRPWSL